MLNHTGFEQRNRSDAMWAGIRRVFSMTLGAAAVVALALAAMWFWQELQLSNALDSELDSLRSAPQAEPYRDPALWAPANEPEGTEPGPVEPLGYESAGAASAQCSGQQRVIPLYRQRRIVGYACGY